MRSFHSRTEAVLLLAILVIACDHPTESSLPPAAVCEVHLQAWFSSTPVTVEVDNARVFSDTVSTGDILALAAVIPLHVSNGLHRLSVTVAGSVSRDTTFIVADSLYIGVSYHAATSTLLFGFRRQPFPYD